MILAVIAIIQYNIITIKDTNTITKYHQTILTVHRYRRNPEVPGRNMPMTSLDITDQGGRSVNMCQGETGFEGDSDISTRNRR